MHTLNLSSQNNSLTLQSEFPMWLEHANGPYGCYTISMPTSKTQQPRTCSLWPLVARIPWAPLSVHRNNGRGNKNCPKRLLRPALSPNPLFRIPHLNLSRPSRLPPQHLRNPCSAHISPYTHCLCPKQQDSDSLLRVLSIFPTPPGLRVRTPTIPHRFSTIIPRHPTPLHFWARYSHTPFTAVQVSNYLHQWHRIAFLQTSQHMISLGHTRSIPKRGTVRCRMHSYKDLQYRPHLHCCNPPCHVRP
jgi:hypothetical protein